LGARGPGVGRQVQPRPQGQNFGQKTLPRPILDLAPPLPTARPGWALPPGTSPSPSPPPGPAGSLTVDRSYSGPGRSRGNVRLLFVAAGRRVEIVHPLEARGQVERAVGGAMD